jgi:hypothetical protein
VISATRTHLDQDELTELPESIAGCEECPKTRAAGCISVCA